MSGRILYPSIRLRCRKDLVTLLNTNLPEKGLTWADEIDDVFRAAGQNFVAFRDPGMRNSQRQGILVLATLMHGTLLQKYHLSTMTLL
jgi:hypothetical protein